MSDQIDTSYSCRTCTRLFFQIFLFRGRDEQKSGAGGGGVDLSETKAYYPANTKALGKNFPDRPVQEQEQHRCQGGEGMRSRERTSGNQSQEIPKS